MASGMEVILRFAGDSKSLERTFSTLGKASDKTASKFDGLRRGAKILAAGMLASLSLAAKVGVQELLEAEKVTAQTTNALRKFGGVGDNTVKSIDAMSEALMSKTGVDDEQIKSMANLLLANENFRRGVGRSQEGLARATTVALDWATATGRDSAGAAMTLNKALANPTKGVALLARAGVKFTDAEKQSIDSMMKHGQVADAQALILGKLEKSYGGAAEAGGKTLAGQLNIAKESFRNLAASLLTAVLPAFQRFVGIVQDVLGWMQRHQTATKVIVGVLGALAGVVLTVTSVTKVWTSVMAAAKAIQGLFVVQTVAATGATAGQTVAQQGLNTAMRANVIGIVVTAIAALAVGLVLAYKKSETFRAIMKKAFDVVKVAVQGVVDAVQWVLEKARALKDWKGWGRLGAIIKKPFEVALTPIKAVLDTVNSVIDAAQRAISVLSSAFGSGNNAAAAATMRERIGRGQNPITGLPQGATGAIVTRPTMAVIGEAGPEAVIPLNRTPGSRPLGRVGGGSIVVNVYDRTAAGMSPEARRRLARELAPEINRLASVG